MRRGTLTSWLMRPGNRSKSRWAEQEKKRTDKTQRLASPFGEVTRRKVIERFGGCLPGQPRSCRVRGNPGSDPGTEAHTTGPDEAVGSSSRSRSPRHEHKEIRACAESSVT